MTQQHTFAAVIDAYLDSPKYTSLAESTRAGYEQYLRIAKHPGGLGKLSIYEIHPADVQWFLDKFADRPGAQIRARVALKAVEKWAIVRRLLPYPVMVGVEVIGSKGGHVPWTSTQVACAIRFARPELGRLIVLASNTGQRGSDLIRMTWADIERVDGHPGINVKQRKTGMQIWVPMTQELQGALASWERGPRPMLLRDDGTPWESRHQISETWNRHRDSNPALEPCRGLVVHGLRAHAVVKLRRAGATTAHIADMVGMSVPMVERYCRFSLQKENAMAAVHVLGRANDDRTSIQKVRG